jgi:hypothetical protein
MREIQTYTKPELALKFNQLTGDTDGEIIDRHGCDAMDFVFVTGAVTTADVANYFALDIYESDDSGMAGATKVAADDLITNGTPGAAAPRVNDVLQVDSVVARVSYRGNKRYLRVKADETGTADAEIGAIVVKGHLGVQPS